MATKITNNDIIKINRLYKLLHTYAAVAREMNISPGTVKRYVIPDWEEPVEYAKTTIILPEFDPAQFRVSDWGALCELSAEEKKEVKDLWTEMQI